MLHRMSFLAFLLAVSVFGGSPIATAAPVVRFSIYAPLQKNAPIQIVGLHYDEQGVQFTLSNDSDKAVIGVDVVGVFIAPSRCVTVPNEGNVVMGPNNSHRLHIRPREKNIVLSANDLNGLSQNVLINAAHFLHAAYLQVQVAVLKVDFADGSKWEPREEIENLHWLYEHPFDSSLVDADAGNCPDVEGVTSALSLIEAVEFGRVSKKPFQRDEKGQSSPPRFFLACDLQGSNAVCPSN
jgi:hypothetical protein